MAKRQRQQEPDGPAWSLPACATNNGAWNRLGKDTRGLSCWARRNDVVAVNAHGALKLYDIADAAHVLALGEVSLGEQGRGALSEDWPIHFIDDVTLAAGCADGVRIFDLSDAHAPRLHHEHFASPARAPGSFVDDIYFASGAEVDGVFAQRISGADVVMLDTARSRYAAPRAFVRVGPLLYVIGHSELQVQPFGVEPWGAPLKSKSIDCAPDVRVLASPADPTLLALVTGSSEWGVRMVDVAAPKNPKVSKRFFHPEPRGVGVVAGTDTLLVLHRPYQEHLALTRIKLARPLPVASAPVLLTDDPELACGALFLEQRGEDILLLATTGRFALLRHP
ncbi:MAG TPA: hypothetical protein VGO62_21920 [Myxococcota bacterium]|jgi:hypothetical protein